MRTLTRKELREITKEIKKTFEPKESRALVDLKYFEEQKLYLFGLTVIDEHNAQRICVPFKSMPSMDKIKTQLARSFKSVDVAINSQFGGEDEPILRQSGQEH